ncbi:hypothetical protein DFH08DRAFT_822758 [Mycena albidolilacea]|uniref:Terpenoid synthase n=1 Tax=Mycena albidolilacea TaxID=1033008 RepID=A0AAD6Z8A0_9AGAR|nr:hypothetical protein DFH08DRAFT_822758 [Mycena albidolilacea]
MENLPPTFCLPPLWDVVDEFKGLRVHPLGAQAKIDALKWLSSYGTMDKRRLKISEQTSSEQLAAVPYYDCEYDDLLLTTEWTFWAFWIDDTVDHGVLTPEGVQNLVRLYEDVHCDRYPEQNGGPLPPIIRVRISLASPNSRSPAKRLRFILQLVVDEEVMRSPEMKDLEAALVELAWRLGDMINFVSLVMIHEKKTIQEAMDYAAQEFRSQVAKWCSAKARALEIYREHKDIKDLTTFIQRNEIWIWIAIEWSFAVGVRYFGTQQASDEAKRTGIVSIMPREQ